MLDLSDPTRVAAGALGVRFLRGPLPWSNLHISFREDIQ
jgi:hypothetical protein